MKTQVSVNKIFPKSLNLTLIAILFLIHLLTLSKSSSLDENFAVNGKFIFKQYDSEGKHVNLDKENNIIITGTIYISEKNHMCIWKLNPNGFLMIDFNKSGFFVDKQESIGNSLAIDKENNIIVTGQIKHNMAVWKIDPQGKLVNSFGQDGVFIYNTSNSEGKSITIDQNDNIFVTGNSQNKMAIWKLDKNGKPVTSFANQGIYIDNNSSEGTSIKLFERNIFIAGNIASRNGLHIAVWKVDMDYPYTFPLSDNLIYKNETNSTAYELLVSKEGILVTGSIPFDSLIILKSVNHYNFFPLFRYKGNLAIISCSIAQDNENNIFIGGMVIPYMHIWKIDSKGNLVNSFGENGIFKENAESMCNSLIINKNNHIIATGWYEYYMVIWKIIP
ncbi:MAG: SBBP repeat-containing protein [Brevinematia bacterium]